MSFIGRLRRRSEAVLAEREPAAVGVDSFEYVRVGHTALTRAAGHWLAHAERPRDFTLEVRVRGKQVDAVRALVEAHPENGRRKRSERHAWRAAFPTSLEAVEDPQAEFALVVGDQTIELEPPLLRELSPGESGWRDDPEKRVREAEAGLAWLQDQLTYERDRRRALEVQLDALRAEREIAASPARAAAEERYRDVRYVLSRVSSSSGETVAKLEEALESARGLAAMAAGEPAAQETAETPADALPCPACDATGSCPRCGGRGRHRMRTCRICSGTGACRNCAGMGWMLDDA